MEPWEDELLWDDDFSDEEEDTEEQIEEADLEMDEDSFADWEDASDGAPENESLEEALAEERTLELESELEQDEHPRDYDAELEDEEEEAAPTSEKRLKREIRAERGRHHLQRGRSTDHRCAGVGLRRSPHCRGCDENSECAVSGKPQDHRDCDS